MAVVVLTSDLNLERWPTAELPPEGEPSFIAGFPRVERRTKAARKRHGYELNFGTFTFSFGRLADRNRTDRAMCAVDEHQEHWQLAAECPSGEIETPDGKTWRGVILNSPFLATFDSCNGYSGAPVFDAKGRLIGVNSTMLSTFDLQERFDDSVRTVATPIARALKRLAIE